MEETNQKDVSHITEDLTASDSESEEESSYDSEYESLVA